MTTETTKRDKCERCKGEKGGTPGNENIIDGQIVCDYCHAEMMDDGIEEYVKSRNKGLNDAGL